MGCAGAGGSGWRWGRSSVRRDERAGQPKKMSDVGQQSDGRRRGRLGIEAAVSIQRKVNAGCTGGRVVSSSLLVKGSPMSRGTAQGSLSNNRLKLTVCGRSVSESRSRSHTAA